MKSLFVLLLCLTVINNTISEDCVDLHVSITQKVEQEGFHRDIKWLIEEENITDFECRLALRLDIPRTMYVNPDQIADLNRLKKLSALVVGDVNVETPAHESQEHITYIFISNKNLQKISVTLPINLRYQRAQITGGFGRVSLRRPSFLVSCPLEITLCGDYKKIKGPCDLYNRGFCIWQNVSYQAHFGDVELYVPIGDLDDYPIVSVVTLLLGCAGCIYILSILSARLI